MTALDDAYINSILAQHGNRVRNPLVLDDDGISLCQYQADFPARQTRPALISPPPPSELFTEQLPHTVVVSVDRGVPKGAHVRGDESRVIPQLPPDHVADVGSRGIIRTDGDLVKVDDDVVGIAAINFTLLRRSSLWTRHVGTGRALLRLEPLLGEPAEEP